MTETDAGASQIDGERLAETIDAKVMDVMRLAREFNQYTAVLNSSKRGTSEYNDSKELVGFALSMLKEEFASLDPQIAMLGIKARNELALEPLKTLLTIETNTDLKLLSYCPEYARLRERTTRVMEDITFRLEQQGVLKGADAKNVLAAYGLDKKKNGARTAGMTATSAAMTKTPAGLVFARQ